MKERKLVNGIVMPTIVLFNSAITVLCMVGFYFLITILF